MTALKKQLNKLKNRAANFNLNLQQREREITDIN